MADDEHDEDEKLHNSHKPDLTWQEMTDLSPEDEIEGSPEIYYYFSSHHTLYLKPL